MAIARSRRQGWQPNNGGSGDRHAHVSSRGASKSFQQGIYGPAPSLRTQEVEIKYKKPMPPGGGQKFSERLRSVPARVSCADFFSAPILFDNQTQSKKSKKPGVSTWQRLQFDDLFSGRPPGGGRSKVRTFASRDRCARNTDNSANFRKLFFVLDQRLVEFGLRKIAAKLGRGGSHA